MSLAEAAESLTTLARSRSPGHRERLVAALGRLCERTGADARPETRGLLADLLTALLAQAAPEERTRLAARLASAGWTPDVVALELASAPLGGDALAGLAERAERSPALRVPLARHPGLTPELAQAIYPHASEALRSELRDRFGEDGFVDLPGPSNGADELSLVEKYRAAGRLGPGALLRFLRDGRREAFAAGLASLSGVPVDEVHEACVPGGDPDILAGVAARAGFDRSVIPRVLELLQEHA